jgi:hypothetical protein
MPKLTGPPTKYLKGRKTIKTKMKSKMDGAKIVFLRRVPMRGDDVSQMVDIRLVCVFFVLLKVLDYYRDQAVQDR